MLCVASEPLFLAKTRWAWPIVSTIPGTSETPPVLCEPHCIFSWWGCKSGIQL